MRGIDPARLAFAPKASQAEHLARHRNADLFLDTLVVNALTTASDALHMGVPVITCPGQTFVSRGAGSILRAFEMPELIDSSLQAYEDLAVAIAAIRRASINYGKRSPASVTPLHCSTAPATRGIWTPPIMKCGGCIRLGRNPNHYLYVRLTMINFFAELRVS